MIPLVHVPRGVFRAIAIAQEGVVQGESAIAVQGESS